MPTLSVATWIGNAAAVLRGGWGAVTRHAEQAGCSRQVAYQHAHRVQHAVADAQAGGPSRADLLREVQELRAENRALWAWLEEPIDFPPAQRQQFAVTAAALGLSLRQIVTLLAIVLPARACPSRATVHRWIDHHARRAGRVLAVLDQACRSLVVTLCLDEIFCHQRPFLVGVEPHSLTWVIGVAAADRAGPTWCQALAAWPSVTYVAADGGTGLHRGLELTYQQRQQAGPPRRLDVNLDNFHIQQEGHRALRAEWQAAERRWAAAEEADRRLATARRRGRDLRGRTVQAGNAWTKATQALAVAERGEAAWRRAVAALAVFRADGRLNERAWAEAEIQAAVQDLTGPRWAKTCRMLLDPRALTFLDRLQRDLEAAEPRAAVREAVVAVWHRHAMGRRPPAPPGAGPLEPLLRQLPILLCQRLDASWRAAYERVARVLQQAVRASSVVECMNSVIRMHQARHRGLSQGLLDLKRLFWNSRAFADGKRKGRCPYAHLGLSLPTYRAWELLQWDPAELAQHLGVDPPAWTEKVSTTDVAA